MSDTVAAIATLMRSEAEALRTIAQNIANAESVAYRREIPVTRAGFGDLASQALQAGPDPVSLEAMDVSAGAPLLEPAVDLRPGTLQSTGRPLDLAVEGGGFFVIGTSAGEVLSRRGDFRLDAQGYLVTQEGDPVLGAAGPMLVGSDRPAIAADGTVRNGDQIVGRLRILEVDPGARLESTATGAYTLASGEAFESGASLVRQGFLETSNVQSVNEMIRLMETMRRFEAAQRFVRSYDDMVGQAITTLGRI